VPHFRDVGDRGLRIGRGKGEWLVEVHVVLADWKALVLLACMLGAHCGGGADVSRCRALDGALRVR
jgi:hypothetical protein